MKNADRPVFRVPRRISAQRIGTWNVEREQTNRHPRAFARRGLSLIETMISVAICTALMVAVAAAFKASANAIDMNDSFFRCSQGTRVTMNQILTEMRRADAVQVNTAAGTIQIIRPSDELAANEIYRQFTYDATNKRVTLQIFFTNNVVSPVYELATNVSAATFGPADMGTDYNLTLVAVRIPVTLTCTSGSNVVTLSGAASPRRAQQF
ncbi:MAG TPA: hypothetical protein VG269_02740 [Tepidisphaeraceae bacterium]|jgi:hypothetical protein|nr:hypothetical protein [Tepidisphaeraceae bacterium]